MISTTAFSILGVVLAVQVGVQATSELTFDVTETNITVRTGSIAVLPCSIKTLGDYQVVWTDEWSTLLTFEDRRIIDDRRISVERPDVRDWNLHIRNVKPSDQGHYFCQVNSSPPKIKKVNLIVQVPPDLIQRSPSEVAAQEGERVKLFCRATGSPIPTVTWLFNGNLQKEEYTTIADGEVMIINNITRNNDGLYKCVVSNGIPPTLELPIRVHVHYAPEITVPNKRTGQVHGKDVILECLVTASPISITTWKFKGQELSNGWKYKIGRYEQGPLTYIQSLRIKNLEREDYGNYTCEATNVIGRSSAVVSLYEFGTPGPTFDLTKTNVTVRAGATAVLPCSVQNLGKYKVAWANEWSIALLTLTDRRITRDERISVERLDVRDWNLHIRNVKASDQGQYSCQVNTNPLKVKKVNLIVQENVSPEPMFDFSEANITVSAGSTAILPCSVQSLGSNKVAWTNKWSTLLTFEDRRIIDDQRISVERPFFKDWNMHIRNVKLSDQGQYRCQVNTYPVKIKKVNLIVQVPPQIVYEYSSTDVTVPEGDTVKLVCNATGVPMPSVNWHRNVMRRKDGNVRTEIKTFNGGVMVMKNISRDSDGIYSCVASNGVPPDVELLVRVTVHYPPLVKIPHGQIGQRIGQDTILECIVTASPLAVNIWKRDGQELYQGMKHRFELFEDERNKITLSLRINNLEKEDFGKYTCEAQNHVGTSTAAVKLYEIMEVEFESTPTTVTAQVGTVAILPCSLLNRRWLKVYWRNQQSHLLTRHERRLISDPRFSVERPSPNEWNLHITNVSLVDQGKYQCYLKRKPEMVKTVNLVVQAVSKAQTFEVEPQDTVVVEGSTTLLQCKVTNKVGVVQWTKNGFGLGVRNGEIPGFPRYRVVGGRSKDGHTEERSLMITNVKFEDEGVYQCQVGATGQHMGNRSRTAHLRVTVSTQQKFLIEPEDVDVVKRGTAELHCKVTNKTGTLLWTRDTFVLGVEKALPGFPRYQIVDVDQIMGSETTGGYILKITDARFEDEGDYGCELTSTEQVDGIRSRKARLNVIVPPDQPRIESPTTVLPMTAGQPQNITCRANGGKPAAEITWYMNNRRLTEMISFKNLSNPNDPRLDSVSTITLVVSKTDDGQQIECRAKNKATVVPISVKQTLHVRYNTDLLKKDIAETLRCRNHPGLAVAVVKDGEVVLAEGFGLADIKKNVPVTNTTLFGVASLSKAFASSLLLKLVSQRKDISLDTKVVDILGDDFGFPDQLRTKYTTLEDILSHRTGLPGNNAIRFDTNLTRENLPRRIKHLTATGTWRGSYIYNNLMYGLVTRIAEVLGGASWEELVQRELYDPLQMQSSNFATKADFSSDQVAKPYKLRDGAIEPVSMDFSRRWALLCGSGCVMTNAVDAGNWMKFHLSKGLGPSGERVMDEDVIEQLYVPRTAMDSFRLKYFSKPDVPVATSFGMYALGWRLGYYRGYEMIVHSGATFGYRALLTLLPTENLGIFLALTGDDSNYLYRFPLQNYIADIILGEKPWLNVSTICSYPKPWFKPKVSSSSAKASQNLSRDHEEYEGIYHNTPYGNLEIYYNTTQGQLMAKYGFARFVLHQQNGDNFFGKGFGINEVKDCSSMMFFKRDNSEKFIDVKVPGFESKSPPVFVRLGYSTLGV